MTNRCNRNDRRLAWVRGNDVLLRVTVTQDNGRTPFDFDLCDRYTLTLVGSNGRRWPLEAHPADDNQTGTIVTDIAGTTPAGTYAIELNATVKGRSACAVESAAISIVENNQQASICLETLEGTRQAGMAIDLLYVTQAATRGKNAYELWRDAGNQGTLQQYLDYIAGLEEQDPLALEAISHLEQRIDALEQEETAEEMSEQELALILQG
mgnify:FL=1